MDVARPRPRPPRERLASLKDPRESRMNRSTPRPVQRSTAPQCPNPSCDNPQIEDLNDNKVCTNCGTMVSDSNIVSEVTFGETSTGAAVVQGGFVGEGQRHARSLGSAFRRAGGSDSREMTESFGRDEIRKQANALSLNDNLADQAFGIYKLAATNNFIQGRRVRTVAAVCLYVACRRDVNNQTLLMDFSELIQVNVFKLGQTYQDLKRDLWLGSFDQSGIRPVVEVENLIMKFARKLEFGNALMKVAEDAAKLVKRMKRDWMATGRRPAGLCGACIILAARMNNFRRTVREVVYVVKVADMTVSKRLEEFKRTTSGDLTVDQFREFGHRLKKSHDPPAIYEARMRQEKKQRNAQALLDASSRQASIATSDGSSRRSRQASIATSDPSSNDDSTATGQVTVATVSRAPRRDADGFAVPDVPVDPSLLQDSNTAATSSTPAASTDLDASDPTVAMAKRKRIRQVKAKASVKTPLTISADDLLAESALEEEINTITQDPSALAAMEDATFASSQSRAKELADQIRKREREHQHHGAATCSIASEHAPFPSASNNAVTTAAAPPAPRAPVSTDPDIGEDEFADDPEVANCLLSERERAIKERIWVTHNEDWLRAQQAKHFKRSLDEAAGGGGGRAKKPRSKGRMGDGSVLDGATPVASPAEANRRMLERRSKGFSKHINYEKLNEIYKGIRRGSGEPTTEAGSTTEDARSERERTQPAEEEEEEEEEEDQAEEEGAAAAAGQAQQDGDKTRLVAGQQEKAAATGLPTPPDTQASASASASSAQSAGIAAAAEDDEEEGDEDDYIRDDDDHDDDEDEADAGAYEDDDAIARTVRALGIDDGGEFAGYDDEAGGYDGDDAY